VSFVPRSPLIQDPQLGTSYPRSAGFDTDIGGFIESSAVGSLKGLMARMFINNAIHAGDHSILSQDFAFGSVILRANPAGHLGQVGNFAPG
jgi:hypothetical protein